MRSILEFITQYDLLYIGSFTTVKSFDLTRVPLAPIEYSTVAKKSLSINNNEFMFEM